MNGPDHQLALRYLLSALPCCLWDEEAATVVWDDGPTITFREELAAVLDRHASRGLPPLAPVLFVLSATRANWNDAASTLIQIVSELGSVERRLPEWVSQVMTQLEQVHHCATSLVKDLESRALLVEYIFEQMTEERTSREVASAVLHMLREPCAELLSRRSFENQHFDLWHELSTLRRCLSEFDPAAFERRLSSSIDAEVRPAEVELPHGERVRRLIAELRDDNELSGLATLARELLACVSLPLPLQLNHELQLGGVSDISNRGTLDQLLVSELAHDDHTLAVRVAMREALYLRREAPPRSPPRTRLVLFDSGIRMWGIPRLFAAAVGLALGASKEKGLETATYRASGATLVEVDLTTRPGLDQHLLALETEPHVGAALPALQALHAVEKSAADIVLVTSASAVEDVEFLNELRRASLDDAWLAAVDGEGNFRLYRVGVRNLQLIREAQLDLSRVVHTRQQQPIHSLKDAWADRPAYCKLARPPLRLPHSLTVEQAWETSEGQVVALSKDHRLSLWLSADYGPIELAANMPPGRVHWVSKSIAGEHQAVIGNLSPRGLHLLTVDEPSRSVEIRHLELDAKLHPKLVTGLNDKIFVICHDDAIVFDRAGQRLGASPISIGYKHAFGPLYLDHRRSRWMMLTYAKGELTWTKLSNHGVSERLLCLAWPEGDEPELHAITRDGCLFSFSSGQKTRLLPSQATGPFDLVASARLGNQFLLRDPFNNKQYLVYRTSNAAWAVREPSVYGVEPVLHHLIARTRNLRKNFKGVQVSADGHLSLLSNRGHELRIHVEGTALVLRDMGISRVDSGRVQRFQAVDEPGFLTGRAEWPGGSTAWLDSRGLLHLRSADRDVSELSIVLFEGATACWSSDGEFFGAKYFAWAGAAESPGGLVLSALTRFVSGLT